MFRRTWLLARHRARLRRMGHLASPHRAYRDLQARLDKTHIGFPEGDGIYEILRLLYTQEEAAIAARMPVRPLPLERLSRHLDIPEVRLRPLLEHMADVGTVMDLVHPKTGEVLWLLSPPVVGFIEFSLMKRREDIDQPALAMAMDAYLRSGAFIEAFGDEMTQLGRTVIHESALPDDLTTEVLAYERATQILQDAARIGVSLCYCRHKAEHLGHACDAPQEVCLNINGGFDYVARHGIAREIDSVEALEVLARCRELGLVQIADNVRHKPIYLCNCCGCCCMQLRLISRHGVSHAVHTSNFLAAIDGATCRGCGRCARRCPVNAIRLDPVAVDGKRVGKMLAVVDDELCLGCGVCHAACRRSALTMEQRAQRVLTPESTMDRVVRMALDRGKLQHLLFDDGQGLPTRVANRALGALLDLPPTRRALAGEQLRSRFVQGVLDRFRGKRTSRSAGARD